MRDAELDLLRRSLVSRGGVELALVFGSRARGDHREGSDLDLAVLGEKDPIGLSAELSSALGVEVDVVTLEAPSIPLLRAVLRDARRVFEARPGAWGSFLSSSLMELETDGPLFDRMQTAFVHRVAEHGLPGAGE